MISYPTQYRNYCIFDNTVEQKIHEGDNYLPQIEKSLKGHPSEEEVIEDLYILNRMLDDNVDKNKIVDMYPILSTYNNTKSPNIQTYLAGIYRKTKIPDAFGPLIRMLIQNSLNPPDNANFDPAEEIGGAILNYLV